MEVNLASARWRKSSYSGTSGCIQVAYIDGYIAVRDSKDSQGPALVFNADEWQAFVKGVRDGEFDRP